MQHEFLNIPASTWNIIFLVIRYVLVALFLAYLTNVYVKRKNTLTDVKGRVTEWQVETYKGIHRWLMKFKSVIAAANQDEEHYRGILYYAKFKIGYQGMEYASFFDDPVRLLQMDQEFNQLLNKEEGFVDEAMKLKLNDFKDWLDEVVELYGAFVQTEGDEEWHMSEETSVRHCTLACRIMGIALQEDVNTYFDQFDSMLRDRLGDIKMAGVYSSSKRLWGASGGSGKAYYNRSQLCKNQFGLMTIFMLVHFEEDFMKNPKWTKDRELFMKRTNEYLDCFKRCLER